MSAFSLTMARARDEGWDQDDILAAYLQASLLSSSPADYTHNCPWNDWTPPSESRRRFQATTEANRQRGASGGHSRVRVRMCLAPNSLETGTGVTIAFASVEVDSTGAQRLVLRRGCETLACMPLNQVNIRQVHTQTRMLRVSATFSDLYCVYLYLEDARRLDALLTLIPAHRSAV